MSDLRIVLSVVARRSGYELGQTICQAHLSQLESVRRTHMTEKSRQLLARLFKVHPGFLISDPEGCRTQLVVVSLALESRLDGWLGAGVDLKQLLQRVPQIGDPAPFEETKSSKSAARTPPDSPAAGRETPKT